MAFTLSDNARDKQTETKQEVSLLLEIDGYNRVFTMDKVLKYIQVGDRNLRLDGSWVVGGTQYRKDAYDYISIDGTTSSISQQLQQDKGGTSSITSFQIALLDYNEIVTELVSPNKVLTDILGRECFVYLGYKDTIFPDDYILLFSGIIDEIESGSNIKLNISNPEQKKRQDIYANISTELTSAILAGDTTIPVTTTDNFVLPVTSVLETYIKINDEIIKYTGKTSTTFTGCTRAQWSTIAAGAASGDSVSSWYRLQGNAIDLALYLMLSGPDTYYKTSVALSNFRIDAEGNNTTNGLFFAGVDVETKYGLTVGDYITSSGATNAANNFSLRQITSISVDENGSVVTIDGAALAVETNTSATLSLKSQYNILPDGLGLGAHQVDVAEFQRIYTLFNASIPIYDFYITDTINAKEFIDKEILFPANLFTLPKKGKISVGAVSPPLAIANLPVLNSDKVTKPESIRIRRSIGKYFYNTVIYKFNYDAVETDKPLSGYIKVDTDSQAQIPIGTKSITIASKGMRNDANTQTILDVNSRRLLAKYKYAAECIDISCFYGIGFNIDVGDIVYFGDTDLDISDSKYGVRGFTPRLCEVIDKKMNIFTGQVQLKLLDTSYLTDGRYGIFSPSSYVSSGSTTTSIIITDSFGTTAPDIEKNKWMDWIGQELFVHSDNWASSYSCKLVGFDPANNYKMLTTPMSGTPSSGWTVDIANYPSTTNPADNRELKSVFCFVNPSIPVVTGVSSTSFTVSAGNVSKMLVNDQILLHNVDYSSVSPEVRISDITGTTITVDASLGFTPSSSYTVELVGFKDAGSAYRYL